jgi:NAD(P)-dependent dehydrogenase (short-subunit alcohol dehydrogenase family)
MTARRVVVTGAVRGIGRATAEAFRELGDEVFALTRAELDVTDEAAVERTVAQLGAVDVLVNNAGVAESAPVTKTSLAAWQRHLDVNATGAFLCARAVLRGMLERDSGVIITIASTAGLHGSPYTSAYTASKHASVGLTRAIAAETAGTGVRANAVCPSFVDTDLTERTIQRIVQVTGRSEQEARRSVEQLSPLNRLLRPEEVAAAVVYLASDAAAAVNGQTLVLDGGGVQA